MTKRLGNLKHINGPAFDSVLLALIQVVTYATNIITTKILSMQLSLTEYGTYATVNSVITIAASLTLFGLGDSLNYYYNKQGTQDTETDRIEYVNTIFLVQLIVGVLVGIVLAFGSGSIANYYNNPLVKSLVLIVCLKPWISNATHLYQVLFVSSGKAKLIAIRNLIISVAKVLLLYLAIQISNGLSLIFVCLVLLDVAQLLAFRYIFGKTKFRVSVFSFCKEKIMPVVRYTVPMGVYFVTTTLMREINTLVVGHLGTTEELAIYANCAKTLPLNILIASFATVLIPYIMKNVSGRNYPYTAQILRKYLSVGYLSVWMFSGALLLCAPEAIQFFYSSEYIIGLPIFVIYILDSMLQFANFHLVIAANGNSRFLMFTSLSLLVLNAVLSLGFYKIFKLFGMELFGPAAATLLISLLYVTILHRKTAKILQLRVCDFLPFGSMAVYLGQLLLVGVPFYFLKQGMKALQISWILILVVICGCYCLTVALLNFKKYKTLFDEINQLKQPEQ